MRVGVILYVMVVVINYVTTVWSYHFNPKNVIDFLHHIRWNTTDANIRLIPGSDGHSTAYYLQGSNRCLEVPRKIVKNAKRLLEANSDFTISAIVKQQKRNSGSILSFSSNNKRYLELESSGRRDEIRFHYVHKRRTYVETFPFKLADNRWHKVALSISANQVDLFIDCQKIYEHVTEDINRTLMDPNIKVWLGQRNARHAYFKGAVEQVLLITQPYGHLEQCRHADTSCPTCGEFRALQHSIQELQKKISMLNKKLVVAEDKISDLQKCECLHSCELNGTRWRDGESWQKDCTTCTCRGGEVECKPIQCPKLNCKHPETKAGGCCPQCLSHCYNGRISIEHGDSFKPRKCVTCTCLDGSIKCERQDESECPKLTCAADKVFVDPRGTECCKRCRGMDYCAAGHNCHQHAVCNNHETQYTCTCKEGYEGDGRNCRDRNECLLWYGLYGHQCGAHTDCVNTEGSYRCVCQLGYRHHDSYMFTCADRDECKSWPPPCHPKADCINTKGSYNCRCRTGYTGNGVTCQPLCTPQCQHGGRCVGPGTCACQRGYIGTNCEIDLDECAMGIAKCHPNSQCINVPGSYHCVCKQGFHSSKVDTQHGSLCKDVNECEGWGGGHRCPAGSVCMNTVGDYRCRCRVKSLCDGMCYYQGRFVKEGTRWKPYRNSCSVCRCKNGFVTCSRKTCDCKSAHVDMKCCPQCDASKHCIHQTLPIIYHHGDYWTYQCQTCQCWNGETDCWQVQCPKLSCEDTIKSDEDCCPHCAKDLVCHVNDPRSQGLVSVPTNLHDSHRCHFKGTKFGHGQSWTLHWDNCTTCFCKMGHICCTYNQTCRTELQRNAQHYLQAHARSNYKVHNSYYGLKEFSAEEEREQLEDMMQYMLDSHKKQLGGSIVTKNKGRVNLRIHSARKNRNKKRLRKGMIDSNSDLSGAGESGGSGT